MSTCSLTLYEITHLPVYYRQCTNRRKLDIDEHHEYANVIRDMVFMRDGYYDTVFDYEDDVNYIINDLSTI